MTLRRAPRTALLFLLLCGCAALWAPISAAVSGPPTITAVNPKGGYADAETTVTITGTNLVEVKSVAFGTESAASFKEISETKLRAVSPRGEVGTVDIQVTTAAGTSVVSAADRFTYVSPFPPGVPVSDACKDARARVKRLRERRDRVREAGRTRATQRLNRALREARETAADRC